MDAKIGTPPTKISKDRKGERGAALVTVMMISFLLLVASIALILETTMNTGSVTDATSEEQAYYAAESGIQSVIDALRHNPAPDPLINAASLPLPPDPNAHIDNRLDYRKAVERRFSNASCDPTDTTPPVSCTDALDLNAARLSRWLPYSTGFPDRVILGDPGKYSLLNGFAFSVEVRDPDNTTQTVAFNVVTGKSGINDGGPYVPSRDFVDPGDSSRWTRIEYVPPGPQSVDVSSGVGNTNFGSFIMTNGPGGPGPIPAGDGMVRFRITLLFSQPANVSMVIRGYILPSGSDLYSVEDPDNRCDRPTASYLFDSQNFLNFGSRQSITNSGCLVEEKNGRLSPDHNGPNDTFLTGWQVKPPIVANETPATTPITASITQPEPTRLLITSTGYGPRGAKKQLESIIQKNYFDGMGAPSPLTLIGPTCTKQVIGDCRVRDPGGVPPGVPGIVNGLLPESELTFIPGTSNPIEYTGRDEAYSLFQPPIGVTNNVNLDVVRWTIENDFGGRVFGSPENIAEELPYWLQNPSNLESTLQLLKEVAQASGSYYGPDTTPRNGDVFGDALTGTGITYIDTIGGASLNHEAGGLLIVTKGGLALRGRYYFKGVMVVTGPDGLYRAGGGGGQCSPGVTCGRLEGNMIIAPYNDWSLNTCMPDTTTTQFQDKLNCFLSPRYDISGGGNSEVMGNNQAVSTSLTGLGNFVKGVAEK